MTAPPPAPPPTQPPTQPPTSLPTDPLLSPAPARLRRTRALLVGWLVCHAFSGIVSIARQLPPAKAIRVVTGPYERSLGVYQSWNMFVPNAPRQSEWLVATGRTADGEDGPVDVMSGDLPPDRIEWLYSRQGKLERNVSNEKLGALRRGWAWWACRREAQAGRPLDTILLQRAERATPTPQQRASSPRQDWPISKTRLSRQACPDEHDRSTSRDETSQQRDDVDADTPDGAP